MEAEVLKSDDPSFQVTSSKISHVEYHEKLNIILVSTEDEILVLDPTLGDVLHRSFSGTRSENGRSNWNFCVGSEKIILLKDEKIGIRSDYNGILLLDTILQTPIHDSSETVQIELNKTEAESLCQAFTKVDTAREPEWVEVEKQLQTILNKEPEPGFSAGSVKKEKWSTVNLELPHASLKLVFSQLVSELWKKNSFTPELSIASSILERLNMLLPLARTETELPLDKTKMFSESARLNTFLNWPHLDYKWALPVKMAQAGFYHNPSSNGEDRAMCFTCNVCLVSWEPTDEPWSEHERHSPFCPFVRGEHTHNVPLSLSYATAPSFVVPNAQAMGYPVVGKSSNVNGFAVGYSKGFVILWDVSKQVKEVVKFEIKISEIENVERAMDYGYSDVDLKPKTAWVMETTDPVEVELPESLSAEKAVTLTALAVLGAPVVGTDANQACPSSIVVGGTVTRNITAETNERGINYPFILIYGLSDQVLYSPEQQHENSRQILQTHGSAGTKQEIHHYDEDIFGSYISEDLMSDSVSIFSDMNMSDSSGTFILDQSGASSTAVKKKQSTKKQEISENCKAATQSGTSVVVVQKLNLPTELQHCFNVNHLCPTPDGNQLIVMIESGENNVSLPVSGALMIFSVTTESNVVHLEQERVVVHRIEDRNMQPVTSCFVPYESERMALASALRDGTVCLFNLADASVISRIPRETSDPRITSLSYCSSLERMCCGTSSGRIELFAVKNTAGSEDEEMIREELTENPIRHPTCGSSLNVELVANNPLTTTSMKHLLQLTLFKNVKPCFSANVPSCWVKIIQAQKDRKHPQHLQHHEMEASTTTLSWRLQRNKNSKKDHLFEITLPKHSCVGHLDIKFSLQLGCSYLPTIEVTLYRLVKGHKNKSELAAVDKKIDFGAQLKNKTPSNEFLKSINAEVVCGPLDLGTHLDLSAQYGTLVMTSPTLMLTKGRNFYLHIKSRNSSKNDVSVDNVTPQVGKPSKSQTKSKSKPPKLPNTNEDAMFLDFIYNSSFQQHPLYAHHNQQKYQLESLQAEVEKKKDIGGCDWINEISLTVRQIKPASVPNEDLERKFMLTSADFAKTLLETAVLEGEERTYAAQSTALDLLVWVAAVNLCGPPIGKCNYQLNFIAEVQLKITELTLQCILLAGRSTAHKCAKLIVLCIDCAESYHKNEGRHFLRAVLKAFLNLFPYTVSCVSAASLQWFFLLFNRVRNQDLNSASETLLHLLMDVSKELHKRTDPMLALLRTRFGLYGSPFEPELFELELPPVAKSYAHPLTYAGMCGMENSAPSVCGSVFHLWGLKDVDFRELLVGNPLHLRWGRTGNFPPKQQIQGLIEVEPLHFTCHAASDGTRIEKVETGEVSTFPAVPLPKPWEPFTNMPTGEGSKKTEPDKLDQIMMLQKALKMDHGESYYDVIGDLKFMDGNINMLEMSMPMAYTVSHPAGVSHIPSDASVPWKGSILTVMPPPSTIHANEHPQTKLVYGAISHSMNSFMEGMNSTYSTAPSSGTKPVSENVTINSKPGTSTERNQEAKEENDDLRLLLSPWQQIMYQPPQQCVVIDRMHSGARRFVVLDFGSPILLTDFVIPACTELVSLSIDIWISREEIDGQRLVVASDIGQRSLAVCDLQPPPCCRYLKITTIGRYGMATNKCRIPVGMFYGHSAVLESDLRDEAANAHTEIPILTASNTLAHLSILSHLIEDIGCRYQLACSKLKRLLDPLIKPEITSLDHVTYYLPKGKERNKLGLNSSSEQTILNSYKECFALQQQLNVAKNVVKRLQKSLNPSPENNIPGNPLELLPKICSDKVNLLNEFIVESLLGIIMIPSSPSMIQPSGSPYSLYSGMEQATCENLFQHICVLENGQSQLSACTLMLRVCGFQPWWGSFLATTLRNLYRSSNCSIFPQDRVFILLVYLGQKALLSGQNSSVLESALVLLDEVLSPMDEGVGFLRSKVDMALLAWTVMYMCFCLDGINCTLGIGSEETTPNTNTRAELKTKDKDSKDVTCLSSRWDFIQGESSLYRRINNSFKNPGSGGLKRRIQKKLISTKQKLEELDNVASGYANQMKYVSTGNLGNQLSALGSKLEAMKQTSAGLGKAIKMQSSKHFKDMLQMRRNELLLKKGISGLKSSKSDLFPASDVEINLSLNSALCIKVAQGLGRLLLNMDSTTHSDVYLVVCKALARISTSCRPAIPLGSIFEENQVMGLIITAVGSDYVGQMNWSSSWISHAIMCLIQDILEGERLYPSSNDTECVGPTSLIVNDDEMMSVLEDQPISGPSTFEMMNIEAGTTAETMTVDGSASIESEESDYEELLGEELLFSGADNGTSNKQRHPRKVLTPCLTSISTALDLRLENGVENTTELRLRMMAVVDSDVLGQSIKAAIECPADLMRIMSSNKPVPAEKDPIRFTGVNSLTLLSTCFDKIFLMMASENCSISLEKILQLWISVNLDITGTDSVATAVPPVRLARESITALIKALTKNTGIGVQEWGLGFQCLTLVTNQRTINDADGSWLYIMRDKLFSQMILKFISGTGMNFQKSNVVSVGPTVCQHFYNFLLRLRELCNDSSWTPCLKEILLRVLSVFLSGPFLSSDFPLDAFNRFLDRVMCPDLSYENSSTVVSIIEYIAQALHLYVFCPNKITVRSNAELKGAPPTTTATGAPLKGDSVKVSDTIEQIMFRLLTLTRSMVSLPYKGKSSLGEEEQQLLSETRVSEKLRNYDVILLDYVSQCRETGPKTIADIISQMEPTVMRILSALSKPNGINVLVGGDLPTAFNIIETSSPTSLVDSVIQLFTKICNAVSQPKWIIQPMFKFLSTSPYDDFYCPLIVSETFVLMVLKVINKEDNLEEFVNLSCVKSVCDKIVASSRKFFSSCPTFVSILTQYIGRTDSNAIFGQKKFGNETMELQEGLINVAPLGSISSTNFSAHPSEILLQASPPHRRARTPVWSYHFFPEENFLELIISLPCAILLKEVQIVPHISTLTTSCPSAIMIEVSRDRNNLTVPMGPPAQCSGMTNINISLSKPEVAQTVLLRLFKPKDSSNLGLSQIRLLGFTTFSEAAFQGLSHGESVQNLESSAQWMYILDRAITVSSNNVELRKRIVDIAVNIPDILESCYAILMSPVTAGKAHEVYLPHAASVLFNFGSSRKEVSEQLLNALLGPVQLGFSHGMVANSNTQSTMGLSQLNTVVDLIYKLCCNIPDWGFDNLANLINWLHLCADNALEGKSDSKSPVPEYIQAVSSALWSYAAQRKVDLTTLATPELLTKLLSWSAILDTKGEVKAAVDHMICSVCYCTPWLFVHLMASLGFVKQMDWTVMDKPLVELLPIWYEEGSIWERVIVLDLGTISTYLNPGLLMTLARASQSPTAAQMLHLSQFMGHLNTGIMEFWSCYSTIYLKGESFVKDISTNVISTSAIIAVLGFYGELCRVNQFKDWFGKHGSIFWLPLLNLLSTLPENLKANFFGSYVYDLESVVINFLSKCCWSHPENQKIIASCLCDIVRKQKATPHKAVFLHSMSSFCRRLIIQLLLENEKLIVQIKSYASIPLKCPLGSLPLSERHPSMGGDSVFHMNTHSYAYELLRLIEPFGPPLDKLSPKSEANRYSIHLKKEESPMEAKPEVLDHGKDTSTYNTGKISKSFLETKRPTRVPAKKLKADESLEYKNGILDADNRLPSLILDAEEFPDVKIPLTLPLSVILAAIRDQRPDCFLNTLVIVVRTESTGSDPSPISTSVPRETLSVGSSQQNVSSESFHQELKASEVIPDVFKIYPLPSTVEVFSRMGGLGILAKHLPVVYPDTLRQIAVGSKFSANCGVIMNDSFAMANDDWVKVENSDDFYDDMMDSMVASTPVPKRGMSSMQSLNLTTGIPPHSMAAFGLFLSLPRFPEVLLRERLGSQCMLRLVMGVSDDADGNDIFGSPLAKTLPILPFQTLKSLLDMLPLHSEEGRNVRRSMVDTKAIHFILAVLSVFTHQSCDPALVPGLQHELVMAATKAQGGYIDRSGKSDDKAYWAKGTGFGTGSTAQSWDIELAMQKKKSEEENVTCLLQVLSSFIFPLVSQEDCTQKQDPFMPGAELPEETQYLLKHSCLFPAIAGYLRNDSVLDLGRHVPLYKSVLQFLRALVHNSKLVVLLAPLENRGLRSTSEEPIPVLLSKLKDIVDSYARRLTNNSKRAAKGKNGSKTLEELEDEGLALLIPDIQSTAQLVEDTINELNLRRGPVEMELGEDSLVNLIPVQKTLEERYLEEMKKLQFAFFEMITEEEESGGIRFTVSHHYAGNVRANFSRSFPARLKRLAQESVTLSTSLPIAFGSTIFVRCDTDRLDIMKVLITGPAGTPYANGCFEFDVYFPNDYPNAPMMINLETTGRQRIRFNPNLYTDGKVCLSILNTWHGRPEEKWNPQTSSLLPVLVAIQSLILNAEPYFNEPGYEKSRGTESGENNSREYNAGIEIATVEWAMLDQIRHPSACFKEIIQSHFWMKRGEIIEQCEQWLEELIITCRNDKRAGKNVTGNLDPISVFKNNLVLLKKEFGLMKPPPGLEDLVDIYPSKPEDGGTSSAISGSSPSSETSKDVKLSETLNAADTIMNTSIVKDDSNEPMITDP